MKAPAAGLEPRPLQAVLAGLAAVVTAAAVAYTIPSWQVGSRALPAQCWCLAAAASWLALAASGGLGRPLWRRPELAPALAVVAVFTVAFLVRHWMLGVLPPPDRAGFEELQMGADGYWLLATRNLPLEFRFTKMLAAAGMWRGGTTLAALRLPFRLLGYARLVIAYLVMRRLGTGRGAAALLTLVVAASRWSVITGGTAYEDFSATFVLLLLVYCLERLDLERPSAGAWAAAAGGLAGILMFENSSFRFAIVLAVGWLAWLVSRSHAGVRAWWRPLALFAGTSALVALPMLVDIAHRGAHSVFFEAILRYRAGRAGLLPSTMLPTLWKSAKTLAGVPVRIDLYLAPDLGRAVQPLTGCLLVGGAIWGLVRRGRPFLRALTIAALGAVLVCSATTDFFLASHYAPVVTLLLVAGAVLLDDTVAALRRGVAGLAARATRTSRHRAALATAAALALYAGLAGAAVHESAWRVKTMAEDPAVLDNYLNNQYLTAAYIARTARPGARVVVITPGLVRDWTRRDIAFWPYVDLGVRVAAAPSLPPAGSVASGTLVILAAEDRPLRDDETAGLAAFARATGSAGSLAFVTEPGDRKVLGSVCVRCGEGPGVASR